MVNAIIGAIALLVILLVFGPGVIIALAVGGGTGYAISRKQENDRKALG